MEKPSFKIRIFGGVLEALTMNRVQALTWLTCWWCWTLASMQFYILPFTLGELARELKVPQSKISEANTTSMLSRTLGAALFGVMADQYGRKVPILIDLVLLGVFTLATGFIQTYAQLVAVRFLFGRLTANKVSDANF
jgi:MFS transporter, SHS family, lactate transporter